MRINYKRNIQFEIHVLILLYSRSELIKIQGRICNIFLIPVVGPYALSYKTQTSLVTCPSQGSTFVRPSSILFVKLGWSKEAGCVRTGIPCRQQTSAAVGMRRARSVTGPLRRAHPASGATWNVQVHHHISK